MFSSSVGILLGQPQKPAKRFAGELFLSGLSPIRDSPEPITRNDSATCSERSALQPPFRRSPCATEAACLGYRPKNAKVQPFLSILQNNADFNPAFELDIPLLLARVARQACVARNTEGRPGQNGFRQPRILGFRSKLSQRGTLAEQQACTPVACSFFSGPGSAPTPLAKSRILRCTGLHSRDLTTRNVTIR